MKRFVSSLLACGVALSLAPAVATAKDLKLVGVTVVDLGNPFFGAIAKSIEAKVKEVGGADARTLVMSGDYDLGKQSTQFDNFIQAGVDLIVVSAVDSKAVGAAVKRAQAAGIPVVAIDNTADNAQATITTDNVTAGKQACQYIADKLGGKGNLIIVNGPPVSGVIDRVNGCKQVMADHPDIKILSDNQNGIGTREGGLNVTTALLTAHDDVDAIFTINDPSAIGADLAAKQLRRTGIVITTVDGSPDIEAALKEKTQIEASSAQLPSELANAAIDAGAKLLNGETLAEPSILVAPSLITRDNVGDYKGWNAQ
ncbi:Periplasmic binding protein/LacI transcriptional regulator [uncultured Pleomorphomonas sp.]|uniref:ABC transporter n=2 Tax=Pleomorphomonas TaxID=261933 RepID=A0A2G9WR77_9HYPH|nr:ABC transporter substrate-binding protein [Pleomorphomonas carboxyditropha]PIO97183.1 ABC transporter [Pleomorphomonas carboxyditropha]SCM77639.1 Periplasmic binding protein/LacI transcriptional regulator [uncultured Pleomorphomonas sp.]